MATVTGLTAARMLEIEAMSIVNGAVDLSTGVLTLQRHDGSTVVAGNVRGIGLQPGGTTGQAFFKKSNADYDAEWRDVTVDGSQVTSGKVPTSRLANHDADSSTGRVWQTTDPEGHWDSEDQTLLLLSPTTDSAYNNALTLSVDGSTVFGVSKTGVLTYGTVPATKIDKMAPSGPTYTNLMGTNGAVGEGWAFQVNDGAQIMGGIWNNAWKW